MVTTSQLPQNSQRLEEVTFECQSLSLACQPLAVSSLLHTHSSRSHPVVRLNIILSNASLSQNENDDDEDDDEVSTKKFFKCLHIRPPKHALCQLIAVGTTPCGNDFYY